MNYLGESSRSRMESELPAMFRDEFPVNFQIPEDVLEEEHGPLNDRSMLWNSGTSSSPMQPPNYNLLDEPSPVLGSLTKSLSLLESMQMQPYYESGYSEALSETGSSLMNYPGESSRSWMDMRKSKRFSPTSVLAAMYGEEFPMNLECTEDDLEEEHGPLNKRSRLWSCGTSSSPMQPANYNLVYEPSPLRQLSLMESPSLYEPIQMQAYETGYTEAVSASGSGQCITASSAEATMRPRSIEKLKASNFPATLLKIGQWEFKSRCVGGLVAKCYFATRKLVWEVMEQGLKSKIEIQWSNIIALKTNCPQEGPGTLTLVLAKQPLFFRETNPQPRKQTTWEKTSDFTYGQASMNRQHFLQCDQGIMNKHIENLVQSDLRLFHLCHQPEIVMDSLYFEDPSDESKRHPFGNLNLRTCPNSISGTQKLPYPVKAQSFSKHMYSSPSSVIDVRANEGIWSAEAVNTRNTKNCVQNEVFVPGQCMPLGDFYEICYDSRNITDTSQVKEGAEYTNLWQ